MTTESTFRYFKDKRGNRFRIAGDCDLVQRLNSEEWTTIEACYPGDLFAAKRANSDGLIETTATGTAIAAKPISELPDASTGKLNASGDPASLATPAERVVRHPGETGTSLAEPGADDWTRCPNCGQANGGRCRKHRVEPGAGGAGDADPFRQEFPAEGACGCIKCMRASGIKFAHMVLCPKCGNKRCPHASDHERACSNSNLPGQLGSVYEDEEASIESLRDSLRAMLQHSGVKDAHDEDKDADDFAAESRARRLIEMSYRKPTPAPGLTPRTDDREKKAREDYESAREVGWPSFAGIAGGWGFARTLERELAEARAEIEKKTAILTSIGQILSEGFDAAKADQRILELMVSDIRLLRRGYLSSSDARDKAEQSAAGMRNQIAIAKAALEQISANRSNRYESTAGVVANIADKALEALAGASGDGKEGA